MRSNKNIKKCLSFIIIFTILLGVMPINTVKALTDNINTNTIKILATTDLHGRFTAYEYARDIKSDGGLTQISTLIKNEKNSNTIIIDNGDTIQGNYNHLFLNDENNPMMLAMNEIGYDVFNLGNHEFNFGMEKLKEITSEAKENLNVLCANIYKDEKRVFKPYVIKEFENGIKVAVIGVVTPGIKKWDKPNLEGYEVTNPVYEVGAVLKEIKAKNEADVYVVSAHMGLDSEYGDGDSATEIAEKYEDISAIIMGHSHGKNTGEKVNNALLIQPGNNGADLAKIEITLEKTKNGYKILDKRGELISTKAVEEDEELALKITTYHDRAIKDARSVIGTLDKSLANENEVKGIPESLVNDEGVTDFVNEVQLYYTGKQLEKSGIDLDSIYRISAAALFDADSNMAEGDITKASVSNIYKYDNKLYTIKTTGKQLKKFMEWTTSIYNTFKEGDLTVSLDENIRLYQYDMFDGISYDINISKEPGNRIENLKFEKDNKLVEDEDVIYLAVNNYRYDSILNAPSNPIFDKGEHEKIYDTNNDTISDMRDLIIDYIINVKNGAITRNVDNNWKLTGVKYDTEKRNTVVRMINEGKLVLPTSEDGRTPNIRSIVWDDVMKVADVKVDIMSFNDFHGNVEESGKNIGAAKLATLIKAKKVLNSKYYEAFVVGAGDLYQGSAISNLTYGKPVSEFLKEIGLVASAVGNHEFDWGVDKIEAWKNDGNFEFLAANIVDKETQNKITWAKPYKIVESNGVRIGIIGITTEETLYKTKSENIKDIEFISPEIVVNKYAKKLKEEENVNAVVVLSHLGASQSVLTGEITGEAAELAKNVYNVDAIIAGHDHQFTAGTVNNVPIVEAGYNGRGLSNIELAFNVDGKLLKAEGSTEEVYKEIANITADETVANIVSKYKKELDPILNEKVANLSKDLDHDRNNGLTPLGIVVSETIRKIADADIAILNGGGIRAPLVAGELTVGDLYDILPFDNTLVTMELKGEDIKSIIEHGIMPEDFGWGQFSGIKVWYDKELEAGDRITSIKLSNGKALEMDEYYKVVINDFMLTGGDGYDVSKASDVLDTNIVMRDSIMEYWKEHGVDVNIENLLVEGKDETVGDNIEKPVDKPIDKPVNKPQNKPTNKPGNGKLPSTGGVDSLYILFIGAMAIGSGIGVSKNKKIS